MSGNAGQVIATLSHAEMALRDRALETLGSAHPNCAEAMPALIRAIEQYGWDEAFASLHYAHFLPQSRESIAWAWKHLSAGIGLQGKDEPWYCYDLACIIAYAQPAARDQESEAEHLAKARGGLAKVLSRPIELSQLSDDELWARFEEDTKKWDANPQEGSRIEAMQLGIALGSRGERFAAQLLAKLEAHNASEIAKSVTATARVAAAALGFARYTPAIKALFDYYGSGDLTVSGNVPEQALARIGGAEVVAELRERAKKPEFINELGARLFGMLPIEESLVAGLETLASLRGEVEKVEEGDEGNGISDVTAELADALLYHMDPRAVVAGAETARLLQNKQLDDALLECAVGVTAELLDVDLPERTVWLVEAADEAATGRSREESYDDAPTVASDNVFYEGFDPTNLPPGPSINLEPMQMPRRRRRLMAMRPSPDPESGTDQRLIPIRRPDAPIGRNDRCPCGSGKKYKNCCFRKV